MSNPTSENPNLADSLLFEQFATLATAPDGIGRLRDLILQLAVQGRLVRQEPGDEPASVLLERISAEKKQLIKNGEIRQEQPLVTIESGDFPKNFPAKWRLSKLGDYCHIIMGQSPESKYYNEHGSGLPFYQGKSEFGKLFPKPNVWCENPGKIAQINDILISVRAPVGPTNICPSESCIGRGLAAIRSLSGTSYFFLLYSLRASEKKIAEQGVGSTFSAISKKDLNNFIIAVPPLAEQHRIVAKVDRLMALCDELEARQQQERAGCLKLGTAIFAGLQNAESPEEFGRQWAQVCDAFDLILDCPENVAVLRQTILQLAVQGRLVRQDPGDEPASVLIERIKSERQKELKDGKIRKLKILKSFCGVEVPDSLPKGWTWIRFPEVGELSRGKSKNRPRNDPILYVNGKYPLVQTGDVSRANNIIKTYSALYNETGLKQSRLWPKGTMCITIAANIAETAILGFDACFPDSVVGFIPHNLISNTRYFEYFMRTAKEHLEKFAPSTAQKNINLEILENLLIPLPPLAEQHRIVAKVDALMALCDQLEAQLKERAGMQGKFADAVVKSIGTG